jgi:hypothetical protein
MEAYFYRLDEAQDELAQHAAMLIVGGSGALIDLANSHRMHGLILRFRSPGPPRRSSPSSAIGAARNMPETMF